MAKQYTKPEQRYEDHHSTGILFLGMGIVGAIVMILSMMGILPIPFGSFQKIILLWMFVLCIGFGIGSLIYASKIAKSMDSENQQVSDMRQWIAENREHFCVSDTSDLMSNELYFQREQEIRSAITAQYPEIEEGLLDLLVEETYQALFE